MNCSRVVLLLILILCASLFAQRNVHDPLTPSEVNQLRDSRQDPDNRLKFFVQFARERMLIIDQLRNDPRLALDRGPQLHDALQDLGSIVEEMDDNVDMYSQDKFDIRKPLKQIVQADTEFQQKLRAMKSAADSDPKIAEELKRDYQFVLDDTTEAVSASLDNATQTLAEQETLAKDKKHNPLRKPE